VDLPTPVSRSWLIAARLEKGEGTDVKNFDLLLETPMATNHRSFFT
jgi:hypothetical protein